MNRILTVITLSVVADSTHIVDCQLKLILGLIWTLILHYSISIPMWERDNGLDEDDGQPEQPPKVRWARENLGGNPQLVR